MLRRNLHSINKHFPKKTGTSELQQASPAPQQTKTLHNSSAHQKIGLRDDFNELFSYGCGRRDERRRLIRAILMSR